MTDNVLEDAELGPPPLRRGVLGLLLGLAAGALSARLLPREPSAEAPPP